MTGSITNIYRASRYSYYDNFSGASWKGSAGRSMIIGFLAGLLPELPGIDKRMGLRSDASRRREHPTLLT
jgi:hypothetical protein